MGTKITKTLERKLVTLVHGELNSRLGADRPQTTGQLNTLSTTVAPAACAPETVKHLDGHLTVLSIAWDRLVRIADRVEVLADKLVGPVSATAGAAAAPPSANCIVEHLDVAGKSIHAVTDRIGSALDRLERL